jgi:hypothetical protein
MTDRLFNELLDEEVRRCARFYMEQAHYEPYPYLRIAAEPVPGTAVHHQQPINPGDAHIPGFLRRAGARYAIDHDSMDPMAIWIVQPAVGIDLTDPMRGPKRVVTIYGITNDGRYNLAILEPQWDEDGRLYVLPIEVHHWKESPNFAMDVLPFLSFFETNDRVSGRVAV